MSTMSVDALRLMTAKEVAEILAVSEKTVYRWSATGVLPCFRQGRVIRFVPEEIKKFVLDRRDGERDGCGSFVTMSAR